jgi:hypothetical protein
MVLVNKNPQTIRSVTWVGQCNKSGQFLMVGKINDDNDRLYMASSRIQRYRPTLRAELPRPISKVQAF